MSNDKNKSNSRSRRVPSVEETTAAITAEQEREETANSLSQDDKSATFKNTNQSSSSVNLERSYDDSSNEQSEGHGKQAAHSGQNVPLVPRNFQKTDERAQKILDNLQRVRETRIQNHSLILDDLKELGMYGELSEDQNYVSMSFEDLHRLVTT